MTYAPPTMRDVRGLTPAEADRAFADYKQQLIAEQFNRQNQKTIDEANNMTKEKQP